MLQERVSISAEFDLPLAALALVVEDGWHEDDIRRAFDGPRAADLVALPADDEFLVALPNTRIADSRVVEERLRKAVPRATVGVAPYRQCETRSKVWSPVPKRPLPGDAENTEATRAQPSGQPDGSFTRRPDPRGFRGFWVLNG